MFGRFDLAALCGCHTLNVCYVMLSGRGGVPQDTLQSGPHSGLLSDAVARSGCVS